LKPDRRYAAAGRDVPDATLETVGDIEIACFIKGHLIRQRGQAQRVDNWPTCAVDLLLTVAQVDPDHAALEVNDIKPALAVKGDVRGSMRKGKVLVLHRKRPQQRAAVDVEFEDRGRERVAEVEEVRLTGHVKTIAAHRHALRKTRGRHGS